MVNYPKDWEKVKIGDLSIEVKKGNLITAKGINTGRYPVIAGGKQPAYYCNKYNRIGLTITISASGANAGYVNMYSGKIFASDCSTISDGAGYCIRYIYYLLLNEQEQIYSSQTGGAQPHVHPKDIRNISVLYTPNIPEQQAIADALTTFDTHISNLSKLIEKKKMIRDGAVEDLVSGKRRLAGFCGKWDITDIGSCVQIFQGGTPKTTNEAYWNGNIVWITPGEITQLDNLFVKDSERKITDLGLQNSSATLLPSGTILLCTRATIGALAIAAKPLTTNQGFKNLVCKKNIYNIFFSYLLHACMDEMLSKAIGTTFLEISKSALSKIVVHIPDYKEQHAIADILTAMDKEISDLEKEKEKYIALKAGAMDDLLTGKIRLV